jgi:putative DNA methylase
MKDDRRLIEDYLPIKAISAEASREKNLRKGHVSSLHLWWARRPLVACRAAVYGALVPTTQFETNKNDKDQKSKTSVGRKRAEKFIEKLCKYPGDNATIEEAKLHILEAHADRLSDDANKITVEDIVNGRAPRPKVLDMFAGGGSIPLEAQRLGCETYALDLNPVAHIIELCTLVYPQKFGQPDSKARGMTGPRNDDGESTWGGLAEEVRHWGKWVLEKVREEIGDLYPQFHDPNTKPQELIPDAKPGLFQDAHKQQRLNVASQGLTPVAYLWTRTVRCKNSDCGSIVPLVKQTWLCKKEGRLVAMRVVVKKGDKRPHFKIVEARTEADLGFDPQAFSKGGNAACPFCATVANIDYVKSEGRAGRMSDQLVAIVGAKSGSRGWVYVSADDLPEECIPSTEEVEKRLQDFIERNELAEPNESIAGLPSDCFDNTLGITVRPYGITKFRDLFTPRQLLFHLHVVHAIQELRQLLDSNHCDAERQAAVLTLLACVMDRGVDFGCRLCVWNPYKDSGTTHAFGRQTITMVWDYSEVNPFNVGNASWSLGLDRVVAALADTNFQNPGQVLRGSAAALPFADGEMDAVICDPPYYDNVPYSDISDFFYVWLKRSIGPLYPEHFATSNAPKKAEAIADAGRHRGNRMEANSAYEKMMADALREANRVLKPGGHLGTIYAHKTTLGWSTLVDALRQAGFTVTEAWPMDTEKPGRLRAQESAALASSILLVARKRDGERTGFYEDEVRPELERIVRERVDTLWNMGISGADLVIAAVGAGLRAFTKFARVEYANGEEVPAERFLTEVEGVVLETLLEKIFGYSRSGVASVDGPSRFYVLWRYAYKATELDAGEAIVFAYPQSVELDGPHGLTQGRAALVEKKKNKYRLLDYTERGAREELGLPNEDSPNGATSLIDILHRILWLMENEPRRLNGYLEQAIPDRERLRQVAQALAGPALKGGETDGELINTTSAEASALGKLLSNWRTLIDARLEEFRLR